MFGVRASRSAQDGHQAPANTVLCSRARRAPWATSNSLDAVIWSSGIGAGPFTNCTCDEHVSSNADKTTMYYVKVYFQNKVMYKTFNKAAACNIYTHDDGYSL